MRKEVALRHSRLGRQAIDGIGPERLLKLVWGDGFVVAMTDPRSRLLFVPSLLETLEKAAGPGMSAAKFSAVSETTIRLLLVPIFWLRLLDLP